MAVVFVNPNNQILEWRHDQSDERRNPLPQGTLLARTVRFDGSTNRVLFDDLRKRPASYTVIQGELHKDGNSVSIANPSIAFADEVIIRQLDQDIDNLTNPLTLLQTQAILRRGLRVLRHVLRRLQEVS